MTNYFNRRAFFEQTLDIADSDWTMQSLAFQVVNQETDKYVPSLAASF